MDIRPYSREDEPEFIALWNRVLRIDRITPEIFRERILLDPNYEREGLLVAVDNGKIAGGVAGFVQKTEPCTKGKTCRKGKNTGYIIVFFVAPGYHGTAAENNLLESITAFFKNSGRDCISFGGYTPAFFPAGVDPRAYPQLFGFLKGEGFKEEHTAYSMGRDLFDFHVPAEVDEIEKELKKDQITFSFFQPEYLLAVKSFFLAEFPGWLHNFSGKILQRLPYDEMVIVLKGKKEVIGYCQHNYYYHSERIGPVGISSSCRGKKIGTVMLYKLLERMAEKGYRFAWFGSTDAAKSYYERAGFKVYREIIELKKEI